MALQVYPPNVVVRTIAGRFFDYRGLTLVARGFSGDPPVFDDDRIISDMERFHYVRLDAVRQVSAPAGAEEAPGPGKARGQRDWVVVLVLSSAGKYAHHSPDLRKLLDGVEAERATKEGRLDELIVVAEEPFFTKKHLVDVIRKAQARQAGGPDPEGAAPFYNAYPYYNFSLVVPEHTAVAPHRLMSRAEVDHLLARERIVRSDLPVILTTDAPIVWNGGREGQVVEITRDSQTAGTALYYRRIERGSF
jgi:DNA-directed RNA polymerase subunit H (RpoH/RPB5)